MFKMTNYLIPITQLLATIWHMPLSDVRLPQAPIMQTESSTAGVVSDYELRILEAVKAYRLGQNNTDSTGRPDGFQKAAERFGVDWQTVRKRHLGIQSLQEFNRAKNYLTDEESKQIIDFIITQARRGFPLTNRMIEKK